MDTATAIGLFVTVVGTVASVWGAIVSINGATKSEASASEARRVRDQLINQRQTSELSELRAKCEHATRQMEKYGPAAKITKRMGASLSSDAEAVPHLIQSVREYQAYFSRGEIEHFTNSITPKLERFSNATLSEDQKRIGTEILADIGGFHSVVRLRLDSRRDHAVVS